MLYLLDIQRLGIKPWKIIVPPHLNDDITMSLETAMKIFWTKLLPTLTYGLEEIWEHLSRRQLQELESLKPRYLMRVLGVSKFPLSRYVYVLARETFLIEDLRTQMLLQHTPAYEEQLRELQEKRVSIE